MAGIAEIALSHDNCPHQVIACGRQAAVDQVAERLREQGVFMQILPIVSGFHSPLFADHMAWYRDFFGAAELREPSTPVWSATLADKFPASQQGKRETALAHLLEPVQFRRLTERLYDDGVRVFVQVGTGSLPGFIDDTLSGQPHLALHANHEARSGLAQLQQLCAALWVEGAALDLSLLQPVMEAPASAQSRKLALGVPLIRLSQPLPMALRPSATTGNATAANFDGPVGRLVQETLADIEQISQDILCCWQQRGSALPAITLGICCFCTLGARCQPSRLSRHRQHHHLCPGSRALPAARGLAGGG